MGSPTNELGRGTNELQRSVTLTRDYYIGVFEVTQKQWERVMGTWPSYFNNISCRESRPVENVSYNEIRGSSAGAGWPENGNVDVYSFMGRLRTRTGKAFDLPTEAQWEYAGRAGKGTALNSGYNLTNIEGDIYMDTVGRSYRNSRSGDYSENCVTFNGTAKAGSYLPNTWGLYDIHGNVSEWCLDLYGDYPGAVTDPKGPTLPASVEGWDFRVVRGGSWYYWAQCCRVAYRWAILPGGDGRFYGRGLRAALTPDP